MPTPDHSNGAPCWIDLMTSDTEKAKSFYGALFGWTFETGDQEKYGGYITARKNGKSVAGMMQKQAEQAGFPDVWSTYLRTDDARTTVKSAAEHGGQVYMEPMDVPEQGSMAMVGDATGAAVGIWQPGEMKGYELAAEAGTAAWHELHTKDYATAVKFYQDVFGWDTFVLSDTLNSATPPSEPGTPPKPGSWTPPATSLPRSRPTGRSTSRLRTRTPPPRRPRRWAQQ